MMIILPPHKDFIMLQCSQQKGNTSLHLLMTKGEKLNSLLKLLIKISSDYHEKKNATGVAAFSI